MTDDVLFIEVNEIDTGNIFQDAGSFNKARALIPGQIYLAAIAGDDKLGGRAHPGEEHLHLAVRGILSFVQDHKSVIQGAPAHEGQRGNLNNASFQVILELFRGNHFPQGIVERLKVGVQLFLEVTGEKAQVFPCFHGWSGKNKPLDLFILQRINSQGYRGISLSRTSWTYRKEHIMLPDAFHHPALIEGPGFDGLPVGAVKDDVSLSIIAPVQVHFVLEYPLQLIGIKGVKTVEVSDDFLHLIFEPGNLFLVPVNFDLVAPSGNLQIWKIGLDEIEVFVIGPVNIAGIQVFYFE